jgi:hypothetical protein
VRGGGVSSVSLSHYSTASLALTVQYSIVQYSTVFFRSLIFSPPLFVPITAATAADSE